MNFSSSWRLLLTYCLSWVVVAVAQHISVPPIDPDVMVGDRPLEAVGTVCLVIPAAIHLAAMQSAVPWLAVTTPRQQSRMRLLNLGVHLLLGAATCALSTRLMPPSLGVSRVLGVWLLVFSCSVGVAVVAGLTWGATVTCAVILVFTNSLLIPWPANILYNTSLFPALIAVTTTTLGAALVGYTATGERELWTHQTRPNRRRR